MVQNHLKYTFYKCIECLEGDNYRKLKLSLKMSKVSFGKLTLCSLFLGSRTDLAGEFHSLGIAWINDHGKQHFQAITFDNHLSMVQTPRLEAYYLD